MPDTLNPESLRRAAEAAAQVPIPVMGLAPGVRWNLASATASAVAEAAIRAYLATDPLRDAIGDLLHMHRQGDVSEEMWGRLAAAFDGAKP